MGSRMGSEIVVMAFSMPDLILYDRTERGWVLCPNFQGFYRRTGPYLLFCIRPVHTSTLNFEDVEEVLPLDTEMLGCSHKASIVMFLRDMLEHTDQNPQIPVLISSYKEINLFAMAQEEVNALIEEGFGGNPAN